jgi:cytochrome c oxidase subunit II
MSNKVIVALVAVFAVVLVLGYAATIPLGDSAPREAQDDGNGVADGDPVDVGQAVYQRQCFGCHTVDGSSGVGPTFQGLYGSEVTLDDGSTVVADEAHIRQAIVDPRATNREGYPDVMPPFDNLEDAEIDGLVAYIRSLE